MLWSLSESSMRSQIQIPRTHRQWLRSRNHGRNIYIYIPYLHMPLAYLCTFTQLSTCAWDNNLRGNSPRCWSFKRISYWLNRIVSYDYSRMGLCNGRPDTCKRYQRNRYVLTRWENPLWMYGWCTCGCSKSRAQALCILLVLLFNLPNLRRHDTEAPTTKTSRGPSCGNIWSFSQWSTYRDCVSSGLLALPPAPGTGQHGARFPAREGDERAWSKGDRSRASILDFGSRGCGYEVPEGWEGPHWYL